MTNQASDSNPFAVWQEWLEKSGEFWSKLPRDAAAADPYQMWRNLFGGWTDAWIKFLTQAPSPELFQRGQNLWSEQIEAWTKGFAQAMGAEAVDPSQMWRHLFGAWSDAWIRFLTQAPSPDLFERGRKLWIEQMEAWTKILAQVMGSEAYAAFLAQTTGQRLAWLENMQETIYPQVDAALRMFNLPSRSQINRLLEAIADVERRLDDLAEQNQSILKELGGRAEGNIAGTRTRRRRAAGPKPTPIASARGGRQRRKVGIGSEEPA